MDKLSDRLSALAEKAARIFTNEHILRAVDEMRRRPQNWRTAKDGEVSCTEPYPMGFYPDVTRGHKSRFYYALGWGYSCDIAPWERWLLRKATSALQEKERNE